VGIYGPLCSTVMVVEPWRRFSMDTLYCSLFWEFGSLRINSREIGSREKNLDSL